MHTRQPIVAACMGLLGGGQTHACGFSFRVVLAHWLHSPTLRTTLNRTGVAWV